MKKILVLLLLLFTFQFSFAENKGLTGIDTVGLGKELQMKKFEKSGDNELLIYGKKVGQYQQEISIGYVNGKLWSVRLDSWHHHMNPNQTQIKVNLKKLSAILKKYVSDKELKQKISEAEKPKNADGLIEGKKFRIMTSDFDTQKTIHISRD